jgi:hypothetical protein
MAIAMHVEHTNGVSETVTAETDRMEMLHRGKSTCGLAGTRPDGNIVPESSLVLSMSIALPACGAQSQKMQAAKYAPVLHRTPEPDRKRKMNLRPLQIVAMCPTVIEFASRYLKAFATTASQLSGLHDRPRS